MLSTQEVMAEVRLPYDVLEDNIERAVAAGNEPSNSPWSSGLQETLVTLIAERAALDLEELCLLGDTAYTNPGNADDQAYLSMFDGWLKLAGAGHVVNWANAAIAKEMFKKGDPVEQIMQLTDGRGVDVAIEALGTQGTFESALRVLRPGGTLSSLGVYSNDLKIPR